MENNISSILLHKGIIGAVIGDVVGSVHEFSAVSSPRFKLVQSGCTFTDDTALTMAVADWLLHRSTMTVDDALLKWGRTYPNAGYGRGFKAFLSRGSRPEQGSAHNGSAMRVSPVGWFAQSPDEAMALAKESALPSHDTPGAVAAAQAIATSVYLARTGTDKTGIREFLERTFGYDLGRGYDKVREEVQRNLASRKSDPSAKERLLSAQDTVQDALVAFLASDSYEEAVRKAVWMGGDSDTVACMAGAVAAAYWGVPEEIVMNVLPCLPSDMIEIINAVDGSSWEPTGVTPRSTKRWRKNDYVVYGTDAGGTVGEQGMYSVIASRFNRHPNSGWPVRTIGASLDEIASQVESLLDHARAHPQDRFLVMEIGISKAGYAVGQIAPLFRAAVSMDNVLLPQSFLSFLSEP